MKGLFVAQEKCSECLFTKGRIVDKEATEAILKECLHEERHFVCHTPAVRAVNGDWVESTNVCCRGFYDAYPDASQFMQIAQRLGFVHFVEVE